MNKAEDEEEDEKEEEIERRNCVEIEKIILKELNARTQQLVNIHYNTIDFSYHYACITIIELC